MGVTNGWQTGLDIFIGTCLHILLLPNLLITLLFLSLRLGHHLLASILRPDLIPVWKMEDALLISSPSEAHIQQNATQIWRLQGKLDVHEFRQHFHTLFLSTPELREKYNNLFCHFVQWGLYCFKKATKSIDLQEQIQVYKGPSELEGDRDLDTFVGKWMSTNDYGEKPNWKILVVHRKKVDESVLLLKIDHGLCDGYTFVHLVSLLSGVKSPYIVKPFDFSLFTRLKYFLTFPKIALESGLSYIRDGIVPYPDHTPWTHKRLALDQEWMVACTTLDLEKVKQVRRVSKCHFNTVLMAIELGALRRYCLKYVGNKERLPEWGWMPSPTAWPGHPAMVLGGMCNHMSCTNTRFPFREEDPVKRLKGGEEYLVYSQDIGMTIGFHWIVLSMAWVLPSKLFHWGVKFTVNSGLYTMQHVMTPLMLSSQKHQLLGHNVEHLYLPVQVPNFLKASQLYMVPVSNSGRMDLTVNATKKLFKDQDELDHFTKILLAQELDTLYTAVTKKQVTNGSK